MSLTLTVTAKGQVTLRREVLRHLGIAPGDRIDVTLLPDGKAEIAHASTGHDIRALRGVLRRPGQAPVTLDDMRAAIAGLRRR